MTQGFSYSFEHKSKILMDRIITQSGLLEMRAVIQKVNLHYSIPAWSPEHFSLWTMEGPGLPWERLFLHELCREHHKSMRPMPCTLGHLASSRQGCAGSAVSWWKDVLGKECTPSAIIFRQIHFSWVHSTCTAFQLGIFITWSVLEQDVIRCRYLKADMIQLLWDPCCFYQLFYYVIMARLDLVQLLQHKGELPLSPHAFIRILGRSCSPHYTRQCSGPTVKMELTEIWVSGQLQLWYAHS